MSELGLKSGGNHREKSKRGNQREERGRSDATHLQELPPFGAEGVWDGAGHSLGRASLLRITQKLGRYKRARSNVTAAAFPAQIVGQDVCVGGCRPATHKIGYPPILPIAYRLG